VLDTLNEAGSEPVMYEQFASVVSFYKIE
jgi:hypothetical protein